MKTFCLVLGFFMTAAVLYLDGYVGYGVARQVSAESYPSTHGYIVEYSPSGNTGSRGGFIHQDFSVVYSYSVAGQTYTSTRARYTSALAGESMVEGTEKGSRVLVYYNPRHPDQAVLLPGVEHEDWMRLTFLLPLNAALVAFGVWAARSLRQRISPLAAGGLEVVTVGQRAALRLARFSPLHGAVVVMAVLSGLMFMSGRMHAESAFVLVLLAGVGAFFWRHRFIGTGRYDLTVDAAAQALELPVGEGRTHRLMVKLSEVAAIVVEDFTPSGVFEQESVRFAPVIQLGDGTPQRLASWADRAQAEAVVSWLLGESGLSSPGGDQAPPVTDGPVVATSQEKPSDSPQTYLFSGALAQA